MPQELSANEHSQQLWLTSICSFSQVKTADSTTVSWKTKLYKMAFYKYLCKVNKIISLLSEISQMEKEKHQMI